MERVSVIDIGTNSILCLVASNRDGLCIEFQEARTARLGRDLASTGRIPEAAIQDAVPILEEFRDRSRRHGIRRILAIGTQVFRRAENAAEACRLLAERTGLNPRIVSEQEEAALSFYGAVYNREPGISLVADIGGGSTELVLGNERLLDSRSLPVGAVVLTQRFLPSDPPEEDRWRAMVEHARESIRSSRLRSGRANRLIAVGGTVTTLAAAHLALKRYDPERVDGVCLSLERVAGMTHRLRSLSTPRRRTVLASDPDRADIILAGCAILLEIMTCYEFPDVLVSDRGLRHGAALQEFGYIDTTIRGRDS